MARSFAGQNAASPITSPQPQTIHRNRDCGTATPFASPQPQKIHRDPVSFTATPKSTPQPKKIHRNPVYLAATEESLPQPLLLHRDRDPSAATGNRSPQLHSVHRNRKRFAASAKKPPRLRTRCRNSEFEEPAASDISQPLPVHRNLDPGKAACRDLPQLGQISAVPRKGDPVLSTKLPVEEVLSQLEARAAAFRAEEAFHAE
jgi:hypothetical protein